jgi:hypothetical protein
VRYAPSWFALCTAIEGDEPRNAGSGTYYLRSPRAQVSGVPELPQHWAEYLTQLLVIGKIVGLIVGNELLLSHS